MNRRGLHETNEIYSRVQNRGCQTSYRKRSFSSNVVIIGRPLVNNSWKDKQDVALEKINQFWNQPDKGTSDKE